MHSREVQQVIDFLSLISLNYGTCLIIQRHPTAFSPTEQMFGSKEFYRNHSKALF